MRFAHVVGCLAVAFEELEIGGYGVGNGVGARDTRFGVDAQPHAFPCDFDGLPVVQDSDAVGIGEIIGMTDRLFLVAPVAEVVTCDPGACGAGGKAPIAEMEAALDGTEVGFGTWRQATACLLGIQKSVQHAARHVVGFSRPQA